MASEIAGVFSTGFKGSGKGLFGKTLANALSQGNHGNNGVVVYVDMGGIVGCFLMDKKSHLGEEIRLSYRRGKALNDSLLNKAFISWFKQERERVPQMQVLVVSGAPRNTEQLPILNLFGKKQMFLLDSDYETAKKLATNRKIEMPTFISRWKEHVDCTRPAAFRGKAFRLDCRCAMPVLIEQALMHLAIHGLVPSKIAKEAISNYKPARQRQNSFVAPSILV